MIRRRKINNERVEVLPIKPINTKKVPGYNLFPKLYCNIEMIARPESGKTTNVYNIIKKCATRDTIVVFIVSTLFSDDSYKHIVAHLKRNKIPYILETSFKKKDERGHEYNQLDKLVKYLKMSNPDVMWDQLLDEEEESEDDEPGPIVPVPIFEESESEDSGAEESPRPKRNKFAPEIIIVCDDMSKEMRYDAALLSLLKEHRHIKAKVIISTQAVTDLPPDAHNQMNYLLLFDGIPDKKLEKLWGDANIGIDLDLFKGIYRDATAPSKPGQRSHNFLYVDCKLGKFRKNFDLEYEQVE